MSIARRTITTLLAALLTAAAAGCTTTPTPSPTVTTSTPLPTLTPTATALSPAEQNLANAKQAVVRMWSVVDRLTNDPVASLQDLDNVATGAQLTRLQVNLGTYRAQGWRGSGSSVVEALEATTTDPDSIGSPQWTVTACVDRSGTALRDAKGESVQFPPYRIRHRSTAVKRADAFRIVADEAVGTC